MLEIQTTLTKGRFARQSKNTLEHRNQGQIRRRGRDRDDRAGNNGKMHNSDNPHQRTKPHFSDSVDDWYMIGRSCVATHSSSALQHTNGRSYTRKARETRETATHDDNDVDVEDVCWTCSTLTKRTICTYVAWNAITFFQ